MLGRFRLRFRKGRGQFRWLALSLFAAALFVGPVLAEGIDQAFVKPDDAKTWGQQLAETAGYNGFAKSYALVVGISDYAGGYQDLPTGNDAKRMATFLFEEGGFDYVHLLTEDLATRDRVAELMNEVFPDVLSANDRFLFYWSGHGDTRAVAEGDGKAGYLPLYNTPPQRWSRMIAMRDIREWNRFLNVKQSLFLLDACFGGIAGTVAKARMPRNAKVEQLSQLGHHVMSAGTETETTIAGDRWGGSLFTTAVLDGLRGSADAAASGFERDGIISLTELKAYVQNRVLFEREEVGWASSITPQVRDLRVNAGEFFFLPDPAVVTAKLDETNEADDSLQEMSGGTTPRTPAQIEASLFLDVAEVQHSLKVLGEDPGTKDGVLGPRSRDALRSWQAANGYDTTGYLTLEQYESLLRSAEQHLTQVPSLVRPPADATKPVPPAVGRPSLDPLTPFRDCEDCPEMVVLPSGAFWMGSRSSEPGSQDDERTRHRVNIEAFAIGKYEVTFDEWDACVEAGGCDHRPKDEGWGRGTLPVIDVSWDHARQYAAWLSQRTHQTYRLPSEAEWEYAARAFPTSQGQNAPSYAFGDRITQEQANFGEHIGRTTKVGSYPANAWDLHDMHGNVFELVEDRWDDNYDVRARRLRDEREREIKDRSPVPEDSTEIRVIRGGSWGNAPELLRSASREGNPRDYRSNRIGFRLARTLTP